MDPQSVSFTPSADIWQLSNTMRNVQEVQQDHGDRLSRLERRHEEDTRVKSVWGPSSPFPSALTGTPRNGPSRHDSSADFASFDDDQSNSMVRSLHLDTDDEPRRAGATSRANSVRFDESANQNLPSQSSRMSIDLNSRTPSGFGGLPGLGGHPLLDRSSSHKSDGRHSSAGQSITSGRANSFGLDSTQSLAQANSQAPALAPGHFLLGPVPSIIRCWLNTDFNADSILYAAVCTGSYKSLIDQRLVEDLGFTQLVGQDINGEKKLKLPVFLPEAVPQNANPKSTASPPRLPSFNIDFAIVDHSSDSHPQAIQIFIGSDVLRIHHADVLFSSNRLTMYDDDRGRWTIPFVRPENESTFKSLYVTSIPAEKARSRLRPPSDAFGAASPNHHQQDTNGNSFSTVKQGDSSATEAASTSDATSGYSALLSSRDSADDDNKPRSSDRPRKPSLSAVITSRTEPKDSTDTSPPPVSSTKSGTSPAIWNNWRRESTSTTSNNASATTPTTNQANEWSNTTRTSSSTYNRPTRDGGIKVLKPTRQASRSSNVPLVSSPTVTTGQSRFFDDGKRRNGAATGSGAGSASTTVGTGSDSGDSTTQPRHSVSGDAGASSRAGSKENIPTSSGTSAAKPRGANPVGGASAFGWLSGK